MEAEKLNWNKPTELPQFQMEWCDLLEPQLWQHPSKRLLIHAPVGFGKTSYLQGYIAWRLGWDPNLRIVVFMNSLGVADRWIAELQGQFADHRYKTVFGDLRPSKHKTASGRQDWTKDAITVGTRTAMWGDPTIRIVSAETDFRGVRCDILIFDDPLSRTNCHTAAGRAKVAGKMAEARSRLQRSAVPRRALTIAICTPIHYDDPGMRIAREAQKRHNWLYKHYASILPGENGEIWPDRHDEDLDWFNEDGTPNYDNLASEPRTLWNKYGGYPEADDRRTFFMLMKEAFADNYDDDEQGSGAVLGDTFWADYQCEPINPDDKNMDMRIIEAQCLANGKRRVKGDSEWTVPRLVLWPGHMPVAGSDLWNMYENAYDDGSLSPANLHRVISCDLAISTSKRACYTVIQLWGFALGGKRVILDQIRFRGGKPEEFRNIFREWHAAYQPNLICVEGNALQSYIGLDIEGALGVPEGKLRRPQTKDQTEVIRAALAYEVRTGGIIIPYGDLRSIKLMRTLIVEMDRYGKGGHDDTVDACAIATVGRPHGTRQIAIEVLGLTGQQKAVREWNKTAREEEQRLGVGSVSTQRTNPFANVHTVLNVDEQEARRLEPWMGELGRKLREHRAGTRAQ